MQVIGEFSLNSPRHPQAAQRGSYLNFAPYSRYNLFFPPFGLFSLDSAVMASSTGITGTWAVDLRTGEGFLKIYAIQQGGATILINNVSSQIGVNYQVSYAYAAGASSAYVAQQGLDLALSSLSPTALLRVPTRAAELSATVLRNNVPSLNSSGGGFGSVASLNGTPGLYASFDLIVDDDNEHKGRPLCILDTVANHTGFIQLLDGDIDIPCTATEQLRIKTYVEGGFFYE